MNRRKKFSLRIGRKLSFGKRRYRKFQRKKYKNPYVKSNKIHNKRIRKIIRKINKFKIKRKIKEPIYITGNDLKKIGFDIRRPKIIRIGILNKKKLDRISNLIALLKEIYTKLVLEGKILDRYDYFSNPTPEVLRMITLMNNIKKEIIKILIDEIHPYGGTPSASEIDLEDLTGPTGSITFAYDLRTVSIMETFDSLPIIPKKIHRRCRSNPIGLYS